MRKIAMTVAALATMTIAAKAQMSIRFAPEVGLNLYNMNIKFADEKIDTKIKPAFKVGGVVDLGITKKLSIQPGVFFSMKGTKQTDEGNVPGGTYETELKTTSNNIEIPVNVVYHFGEGIGDGLFVQAGPYLGYAFGGKIKGETVTKIGNTTTTVERDDDLEIGDDAVEDDLKPLDFGLNIGVGYQLPMGLFARAQYGLGLANLQPGGDSKNSAKNWGIGISVGYFFGGN